MLSARLLSADQSESPSRFYFALCPCCMVLIMTVVCRCTWLPRLPFLRRWLIAKGAHRLRGVLHAGPALLGHVVQQRHAGAECKAVQVLPAGGLLTAQSSTALHESARAWHCSTSCMDWVATSVKSLTRPYAPGWQPTC